VGFGIRDAATAEAVARIADAVVVGSRIVNEIETAPESEVVSRVKTLVQDLRRVSTQRQSKSNKRAEKTYELVPENTAAEDQAAGAVR